MTFGELKAAVARSTKINPANTTEAALIADAINVAYYDLSRENVIPELLITDVALPVDNLGTKPTLPVNFLKEDRIRFTENNSGQTWRLFNRKDRVPPAPIYLYPRAYEIVGDAIPGQLALKYEPFLPIQPADILTIDYFKAPDLLVLDADTVVTNIWDSEIIKRAINYIQISYGKIEQAKAMWQTRLAAMTPPQSQ